MIKTESLYNIYIIYGTYMNRMDTKYRKAGVVERLEMKFNKF